MHLDNSGLCYLTIRLEAVEHASIAGLYGHITKKFPYGMVSPSELHRRKADDRLIGVGFHDLMILVVSGCFFARIRRTTRFNHALLHHFPRSCEYCIVFTCPFSRTAN
jgi:hypothetical protein